MSSIFKQALNHINEELLKLDPNENELFDVVLMSNHRAQGGITLINSINYHGGTIFLSPDRLFVNFDAYFYRSNCGKIVPNRRKQRYWIS